MNKVHWLKELSKPMMPRAVLLFILLFGYAFAQIDFTGVTDPAENLIDTITTWLRFYLTGAVAALTLIISLILRGVNNRDWTRWAQGGIIIIVGFQIVGLVLDLGIFDAPA